jgi:polyphosphate glucokinase
MSVIYGVDVGGSGIKGAPVDLELGALTKRRTRIQTPKPSTPEAVFDVIEELLDAEAWKGPLGVAIPAVVVGGVAKTAANIDDAWIGTDVAGLLSQRRNRPVVVLNDADAAGVAEMRYGAGRDSHGVVIVLTFGTGVGSGMFVDGVLVPNTELGHMQFRGEAAELSTAARLVEDEDMPLKKWARQVDLYLKMVHRVFSPQRIIVGGGISKNFEDFAKWLDVGCEIVPAELRNQAGIVGAAVAAASAGKD